MVTVAVTVTCHAVLQLSPKLRKHMYLSVRSPVCGCLLRRRSGFIAADAATKV
jgi:hypothetical protein